MQPSVTQSLRDARMVGESWIPECRPVHAEKEVTEFLLRALALPESFQALKYLSTNELKQILRQHEGNVFGTRETLIARIEAYDQAELEAIYPDPPLDSRCVQTREMVMAAVTKEGWNLRHANMAFRGDLEIVKVAIANNPKAMACASESKIRNFKHAALECVKINGLCLQDTAQHLRSDLEMNLAALAANPEAIQFSLIPTHPEVLKYVLSQPGYGNFIGGGTSVQRGEADADGTVDLSYVLLAVKNSNDGTALASMTQRVRELVRVEAVSANGNALQYFVQSHPENPKHRKGFPRQLCYDRPLVELAVKQDGLALEYAALAFQDDDEIVRLAVLNNPWAAKFISPKKKNDPTIALCMAFNSSAAVKKLMNLPPYELILHAAHQARAYAYAAFLCFKNGASRYVKTTVDDETVVVRKTMAHSPALCLSSYGFYVQEKVLGLIGSYLGDPTGKETRFLSVCCTNLRYADLDAVSQEELKHMRQQRRELNFTFLGVCAAAGGAQFEGFEQNLTFKPRGAPPPRIFTAGERDQVLGFLASSTSMNAANIASAHLREGTVPQHKRPKY